MRTSVAAFVVLVVAIAAPLTAMATTQDSGFIPRPAQRPVICDGHSHQHTAAGHRKWSERYWGSYTLSKKVRQKHRHQVRCAASPRDAQMMRERWRKIQRSVLPRNHDLWVAIGRCEQPGSGYRGVNWSHTGPTYQGGLGFWYGTWSGFKYPGMPSNAGYASWRQQMKVANRLYSLYGTSPWGCA